MDSRLCLPLPRSPGSDAMRCPFPNNTWAWRGDLIGKTKAGGNEIFNYTGVTSTLR